MALTNFFGELIKNHNPENKYFYKVYWEMVDPKRWEQIKQYQKNKKLQPTTKFSLRLQDEQ